MRARMLRGGFGIKLPKPKIHKEDAEISRIMQRRLKIAVIIVIILFSVGGYFLWKTNLLSSLLSPN